MESGPLPDWCGRMEVSYLIRTRASVWWSLYFFDIVRVLFVIYSIISIVLFFLLGYYKYSRKYIWCPLAFWSNKEGVFVKNKTVFSGWVF